MKLTELDPHFIRYEERIETWERAVGPDETWRERGCPTETVTGPRQILLDVPTIAEAQGVRFLCPKCFASHGGAVGTHSVICWAPSVPQTVTPTGGRWELLGAGLGDLTLRAGSSSVLLTSGCHAHFFIEAGAVRMC
jgi:hypothetical protein